MAISDRTKRLLWSRSGGYCQNPACNREVFAFFESGDVSTLGELAHIIGQSEHGPRGKDSLGREERDEYENIILLCPTCHTLVDKNPEQYPADTLHMWKRHHEEKIRQVFVVPICSTRDSLATVVHKLLRRNEAIFRHYGPHSQHSANRENLRRSAIRAFDVRFDVCLLTEAEARNNSFLEDERAVLIYG